MRNGSPMRRGSSIRAARTLTLSAVVLAVSVPAAAQVTAGDSVRLRVTGALRVEAMATGMRGDTLLLSLAGLAAPWEVPISNLESLEAYIDRSPRDGLRYGVAIGAGAGLFAGALSGVALYATGVGRTGGDEPTDMISSVLSWSGVGIVAGAITGAVVGGARPGRGWVVIPLPRR